MCSLEFTKLLCDRVLPPLLHLHYQSHTSLNSSLFLLLIPQTEFTLLQLFKLKSPCQSLLHFCPASSSLFSPLLPHKLSVYSVRHCSSSFSCISSVFHCLNFSYCSFCSSSSILSYLLVASPMASVKITSSAVDLHSWSYVPHVPKILGIYNTYIHVIRV